MPDLDPPTRPGPLPWRDRLDLLTQPPTVSPSRLAAGAALAIALAIGAWLLVRSPDGPPPETYLPMADDVASSSTSTTRPTSLLVHAAGAVRRPGVYELRAGSRVTDLIDAAGGPTDDADLDQLNLAAPVNDGERVYVPRVGEIVLAAGSGTTTSPSGPLNLNTATLEQLDELPGVGPATARAIIDERDRRGGFASVDDLLDVRGIGPSKLEALRDLVTV